MKVSGLKYLAKQGVENIWKNRMMSFASFCVLLVSLLLVGVATLFYMNISSMMGGIENKNEIIVYLDENTTQEEVSVLKGQLSQIDNIAEVKTAWTGTKCSSIRLETTILWLMLIACG